jgi:hypothetical protein
MFKSLKMSFKTTAAAAVLSAGLFSAPQVMAGSIVQCGTATCTSDFTVTIGGNDVGGGLFTYDAKTGDIALSTDGIEGGVVTDGGGIMWTMGDNQLMVNSLSGNADPILLFGVGATTGANSSSFGFTFNLPVQIAGQISANSSVSYSLTAGTAAGAQITPIFTNVVSAFELDTDIGGLGSLNKGVDVGNTFGFVPAGVLPETQNSPVYTASNTFTGSLAYDLMVVKVDFGLTANSAVGISGGVQQVIPVPAAVWLFGSGLIGLIGVARRKVS